LNDEDLFDNRDDHMAEHLKNQFDAFWKDELKNFGPGSPNALNGKKPSLSRALRKAFGYQFIIAGICKLIYDGLGFALPLLLQELINFVTDVKYTDSPPPTWKGYAYAVGMFVAPALQVFFANYFYRASYSIGIRVRACLSSVLFQKSLVLSPAARARLNTGQIVNMMAVDCMKVLTLFFHLTI